MKRRVSKRAILMWTFGGFSRPLYLLIVGLFVFSILLYFSVITVTDAGLWATVISFDVYAMGGLGAVIALLFLSFLSNSSLKYYSQYFEIGDDALKFVTGIISQREIFVPYGKIQSINIQVTVAEQVWGLADLMIQTSGHGGTENPDMAEGFLSGLKYSDAVAIKDELFRRMNNPKPVPSAGSAQPAQ